MRFTERLLRLKHWQLFILQFVIPFGAGIITMVAMVFTIVSQASRLRMNQEPDLTPIIPFAVFFFLCGFIGIFFQMAWQWSVATRLQQYMHPEMRLLKVNRYKLLAIIPFVYMAFSTIVFPLITLWSITTHSPPSVYTILPLALVLFLGNLAVVFCLIYCTYFVAKTLVSAEMKREAHFSDYIGEFFLIMLFPVGIWFIQPRINALVDPTSVPPKPAPTPRPKPPQPPAPSKPPTTVSEPINQEDFFKI